MPLLPIGRRLDQLEEACRVIKSLLTRETTTFEGKHYR
jgi:alkanesulfonate monooxygenase SsuD/methylene tetrahydromethanopterin reductase-like flavin-dependent oxidoreductase (luciferase family)